MPNATVAIRTLNLPPVDENDFKMAFFTFTVSLAMDLSTSQNCETSGWPIGSVILLPNFSLKYR